MTAPHSVPPAPPDDSLPVLGHTAAFARDPFGFVRRAVDSSGDVFRIELLGRDVYVLAHPDHVESVLLDREAFAKLDDFEVAFGESLLAVAGETWRRQRHAMEEFFAPKQVGAHAETMVRTAAERADGWSPGGSVNVDEEMQAVALRNLFTVVLGQSPDADELDDLADAAHALNLWFEPTSWVLPEWVPTPARLKFKRASRELRDRARTLLSNAGDAPRDDSLLARLADLRGNPESEFDRSEVLDQVVGMLFAGHETTALSMTYALHGIGAHPDVGDRLRSELDDATDGRPSGSDLQELEYLDRVVNETLRLYPPVHAIPRVTTEAVDVGGYTIPADSDVLLSVWSLHRDERFYDDPLTFDPDRWANSAPRERGHAFVPFGAGPRICIGRHFARLEMKAVLAAVLARYRLTAEDDLEVTPKMTTQPKGHVPIHIERA